MAQAIKLNFGSNCGNMGRTMKVVETRITTKTSKSKTATKQVARKQNGRKWIELTPKQFRDRFINLVGKPASLPYPEKGGKRSDLALASAPWIRKALDGDVIKTFKRPVMWCKASLQYMRRGC